MCTLCETPSIDISLNTVLGIFSLFSLHWSVLCFLCYWSGYSWLNESIIEEETCSYAPFVHCLDASKISLFGEWLVEMFNSSCLTDVMCSTRKMKGLSCTEKFAMVSLWLQRCLWWGSVLIIAMFGSKVLNSLTLIGSSTKYTNKVKKEKKKRKKERFTSGQS